MRCVPHATMYSLKCQWNIPVGTMPWFEGVLQKSPIPAAVGWVVCQGMSKLIILPTRGTPWGPWGHWEYQCLSATWCDPVIKSNEKNQVGLNLWRSRGLKNTSHLSENIPVPLHHPQEKNQTATTDRPSRPPTPQVFPHHNHVFFISCCVCVCVCCEKTKYTTMHTTSTKVTPNAQLGTH